MHFLAPNQETIVYDAIDGEVLIINLETGNYYSMVDSASVIWNAIEPGITQEQLVEGIAEYFDEDKEKVMTGVNAFVEQLLSEDIITKTVQDAEMGSPLSLPGEASPLPFAPPTLLIYTEMSDLLLMDPLHDVDDQGWPNQPIEQ